MDEFPQIEVSFIVEGKDFDLKQFTKEIDILPTEVRKKEDWPEEIKNNTNLPDSLQPRCVWCICKKGEFSSVEAPVREIMLQLKGKEKKLIEFCKENNLKKSVIIVVRGDAMSLPEIVFASDIVSYFGRLGVEIGFDMYTY